MKRYVKELANDRKNSIPKNSPVYAEFVAEIERALKACERGLITDFEAVKIIMGYYKQ